MRWQASAVVIFGRRVSGTISCPQFVERAHIEMGLVESANAETYVSSVQSKSYAGPLFDFFGHVEV